MPKKFLNRADILAVNDCKTKDVPVDLWGGSVRIKVMNGLERDQFEKYLGGEHGASSFVTKLLSLTLVDEEGEHMFTHEDMEGLAKKNGVVLQKLSKEILDFNSLTAESLAVAEKN